MSKILVCDLCGEPLSLDEYYNYHYRIKKQLKTSWWETSWVKIDAHNDCVKELLDKAYAKKVAGV